MSVHVAEQTSNAPLSKRIYAALKVDTDFLGLPSPLCKAHEVGHCVRSRGSRTTKLHGSNQATQNTSVEASMHGLVRGLVVRRSLDGLAEFEQQLANARVCCDPVARPLQEVSLPVEAVPAARLRQLGASETLRLKFAASPGRLEVACVGQTPF